MGSGRGLDGISPTDLGITLLYMDSKSFDWPLWRYVTVSRMTVFKKRKKRFSLHWIYSYNFGKQEILPKF
jgi:hypothetical protein